MGLSASAMLALRSVIRGRLIVSGHAYHRPRMPVNSAATPFHAGTAPMAPSDSDGNHRGHHDTVACDGGGGALGHPQASTCSWRRNGKIDCPYCGGDFTLEAGVQARRRPLNPRPTNFSTLAATSTGSPTPGSARKRRFGFTAARAPAAVAKR